MSKFSKEKTEALIKDIKSLRTEINKKKILYENTENDKEKELILRGIKTRQYFIKKKTDQIMANSEISHRSTLTQSDADNWRP